MVKEAVAHVETQEETTAEAGPATGQQEQMKTIGAERWQNAPPVEVALPPASARDSAIDCC